jgi:hypothetical protein
LALIYTRIEVTAIAGDEYLPANSLKMDNMGDVWGYSPTNTPHYFSKGKRSP